MAAIATVIVLALAMTGCSDLRTSAMPTSPTSTDPAPVAAAPVPVGRVVRTELWTLDLTMREVYGAGECNAGIGTTRQVLLRVEFTDHDAVAMQYRQRRLARRPGEVDGVALWRRGRGIGTGLRAACLAAARTRAARAR